MLIYGDKQRWAANSQEWNEENGRRHRAFLDEAGAAVLTGGELVQDKLPQHLRGPVGKKMRTAHHADSALLAEAQRQALARELDKAHPRVAASLREGLAETATVLRLGVPRTFARTFRSTNAIESMIGVCR